MYPLKVYNWVAPRDWWGYMEKSYFWGYRNVPNVGDQISELRQNFSLGFFLNRFYILWKARIWRFLADLSPELAGIVDQSAHIRPKFSVLIFFRKSTFFVFGGFFELLRAFLGSLSNLKRTNLAISSGFRYGARSIVDQNFEKKTKIDLLIFPRNQIFSCFEKVLDTFLWFLMLLHGTWNSRIGAFPASFGYQEFSQSLQKWMKHKR